MVVGQIFGSNIDHNEYFWSLDLWITLELRIRARLDPGVFERWLLIRFFFLTVGSGSGSDLVEGLWIILWLRLRVIDPVFFLKGGSGSGSNLVEGLRIIPGLRIRARSNPGVLRLGY